MIALQIVLSALMLLGTIAAVAIGVKLLRMAKYASLQRRFIYTIQDELVLSVKEYKRKRSHNVNIPMLLETQSSYRIDLKSEKVELCYETY